MRIIGWVSNDALEFSSSYHIGTVLFNTAEPVALGHGELCTDIGLAVEKVNDKGLSGVLSSSRMSTQNPEQRKIKHFPKV